MGLVQGVWRREEVSATLTDGYGLCETGKVWGQGAPRILGGESPRPLLRYHMRRGRARSWGTGAQQVRPAGELSGTAPRCLGLAPCPLRVLGSGSFSSSRRWCHNGVRWL